MNTLLSLSDDEIDAVIEYQAAKIGQRDVDEAERAIRRIEQLERSKQSSHTLYDMEDAA